jgi:hypothetical protein
VEDVAIDWDGQLAPSPCRSRMKDWKGQGGNPIQLQILKVAAEKILDASVDRAVV